MNGYLKWSASEFLKSLHAGKSIGDCERDERDRFFVSLLDSDGLVERSEWLDEDCLRMDVDEFSSLVSGMARTLTDQKGLVEYASFVGVDGRVKRVVVERIRERLNLVVFGAGHVGRAVARLGAFVGYEVIIVDDRLEVLSCGNLLEDGVQVQQVNFGDELNRLHISRDAAVVIVTRGHQYDEVCLRYAIGSPAFYIGMIGSKRRVLSIFRKLEMEGLAVERLKSVFAPIGLRIGAVSPQEIAVSIVAEIISCVRGENLEGKCHLRA
jgi:xanthine/CO dehydrogenase XdhC/CoxF family maturation factor